MTTTLLYLLFLCTALVSVLAPWIGIVAAYLIAIMTPQNIWWWAFQDVRPLMWVLAPALAGTILLIARRKVDFSIFNTKINRYVIALWVTLIVSYYFGPYVDVFNSSRFYDVPVMFSNIQKTFLTYFAAVLLIDTKGKLKCAALVILVTVAYMTYWANAQYLFHGAYGRLHGPTALDGYSIYHDENIFAVLFVAGAPFLFYCGQFLKSKSRLLAWCVWLVIPLSWHAVFLTASRGALLATVGVLALFVWRSRSKTLGVCVLVLFAIAFEWQAGDLMRDRIVTVADYQEDDSASGRLDAWAASLKMMAAHPLTGVGYSSFGQAFPSFSKMTPRIAHNTFFQIAGEQGVIAAMAFVMLTLTTLNGLRRTSNRLRRMEKSDDVTLYIYFNEACLLGFFGFNCCALFLSLSNYDILYYLLLLSNKAVYDGMALTSGTAAIPAPKNFTFPRAQSAGVGASRLDKMR